MKYIFPATLIVFSGLSSWASSKNECRILSEKDSDVVLSCSFEFGPTTEAIVVQNGRKLLLQERTVDGGQFCRTLTRQEWNSQKIRLKVSDPTARASISNSKDSWLYTYRSSLFTESYLANCRRPH
jgi:hypothetical protein